VDEQRYFLTRNINEGTIDIHFSDATDPQAIDMIESCLSDGAFIENVTRCHRAEQSEYKTRLSLSISFAPPVLASIRYLCRNAGVSEMEVSA
jgi:hypothetical protein